MTDPDDPQEDGTSEYEAQHSRWGPPWLVPSLVFGIALVVGLAGSLLLIHSHRSAKPPVATDVATTADPVHKPLPTPTSGGTTSLPAASPDSADAPHIESTASDAVEQPSSEESSPEATDSTPDTGSASQASPTEAGAVGEDTEPQVLARSQPEYPEEALRSGIEGEVRLKVSIDAQGGISEIRITDSSGSNDLDRAAVDSMRTWRFKPATHDGQPVEGTIEVPLKFSLGEQR